MKKKEGWLRVMSDGWLIVSDVSTTRHP